MFDEHEHISKAATINILILIMDLMNDMQGVASSSDKPIENYHHTLQFLSALGSKAVLVHSHCSHQHRFQAQQTAYSVKKL